MANSKTITHEGSGNISVEPKTLWLSPFGETHYNDENIHQVLEQLGITKNHKLAVCAVLPVREISESEINSQVSQLKEMNDNIRKIMAEFIDLSLMHAGGYITHSHSPVYHTNSTEIKSMSRKFRQLRVNFTTFMAFAKKEEDLIELIIRPAYDLSGPIKVYPAFTIDRGVPGNTVPLLF